MTPIADSVATGAFDTNAPGGRRGHEGVPRRRAGRDARGPVLARRRRRRGDGVDLDLFVYKGGNFVDLSASAAADEQVTLIKPAAGTYDVYVNGFSGGTLSYAISNFVVPSGSAGNASVTPDPAQVTIAVPVTLTASWTGLDTTKRWFGAISYAGQRPT